MPPTDNTANFAEQLREALHTADKASRLYNELSTDDNADENDVGAALDAMLKAHQDLRRLLANGLSGGIIQVTEGAPEIEETEEEPDEEGDDWLSLTQAAKLLEVSRPTITNNLAFYMAQGIKFKRYSAHRVKLSRKSIEAFKERVAQSAADVLLTPPESR